MKVDIFYIVKFSKINLGSEMLNVDIKVSGISPDEIFDIYLFSD